MNAKRRFTLVLSVGVGFVALAFLGWKLLDPGTRSHGVAAKPASKPAASKAAPDDFERVLAVLAHSGTALEIGNAIGFLDTVTRVGKGLAPAQRASMLAALERGKPSAMVDGSWSHLFNCACNALATGQPAADEALLSLLERVAVDDPRLVMRLFALQHLGRRYASAPPASQERLRTLVRHLMDDPSSKTTGTALTLWREWEPSAGPRGVSSLEFSRSIAADSKRPVDVRVTALHAIGDDPGVLDLARTIATDRSQPIILRKVALNLIGRHGGQQDLPALQQCSKESPRLAQAGEPAAHSLENRLAGIATPALRPY